MTRGRKPPWRLLERIAPRLKGTNDTEAKGQTQSLQVAWILHTCILVFDTREE
jgi:hypothetical protein